MEHTDNRMNQGGVIRAAAPMVTTATRSSPRSMIRPWAVSFGNPALGTYHGIVYTLVDENDEHHDDDDNNKNKNKSNDKVGKNRWQHDLPSDASLRRTSSSMNHHPFMSSSSLPSSSSSSFPPVLEHAQQVSAVAAMVDVPPEQIPEGIFHVARSYRPWIQHWRMVIAQQPQQQQQEGYEQIQSQQRVEVAAATIKPEEHDSGAIDIDDERQEDNNQVLSNNKNNSNMIQPSSHSSQSVMAAVFHPDDNHDARFHMPLSPHATAMENAACILAAEQQQQQQQHTAVTATVDGVSYAITATESGDDHAWQELAQLHLDRTSSRRDVITSTTRGQNNGSDDDNDVAFFRDKNSSPESSLRYIVLLQLSSEAIMHDLVRDLHEQPYTSLDETDVCRVYRVVALHGRDGVSLLSPFFAAPPRPPTITSEVTTTTTTTTTTSMISSTAASTASSVPVADNGGLADGTNHRIHTSNTSCTAVDSNAAGLPTAHSEDYNCAVCLEHMDLIPQTPTIPTTITDGSDDDNDNVENNIPCVSIFTTVCNHSFHMDCLLQWHDSPCPVCRYDHSGMNNLLSQCHICGTTERNYVCLICGVISCSSGSATSAVAATSAATARGWVDDEDSTMMVPRENCDLALATTIVPTASPTMQCTNPKSVSNLAGSDSATTVLQQQQFQLQQQVTATHHRMSISHAQQHYDQTLHAYALDTETQHVWDFAGQGYVHRLLQNKDDGKLVEVVDPNNTRSQARTLSPGLSQAQEGEMVHRKLEGYASQYYTLLKSQLEQQRIYYQGRLQEIRREYIPQASSSPSLLGNRHSKGPLLNQQQHHMDAATSKPRSSSSDLIAALKQERHQLSQRLDVLNIRRRKVQDDVAFLCSMNESLQSNQEALKQQLFETQRDRQTMRETLQSCLPALQEQVTCLMLQLEHESLPNNSNNNSNNNGMMYSGPGDSGG